MKLANTSCVYMTHISTYPAMLLVLLWQVSTVSLVLAVSLVYYKTMSWNISSHRSPPFLNL